MSLPVYQVSPDVAVAPQLEVEQLAEAAAAGFKSVINNRPDHEDAEQPTNEAVEAAARAAGLEYAFLPVQSAFQTPEQAERFRELLDTMPKPILAFCRSGTRSHRLYRHAMSLPR